MTSEGTPAGDGRGRVLWQPPADVGERSRIGRYTAWLAAERGHSFAGYDELWQWSVADLDGFWRSIWDHFSARVPHPGHRGARRPGHAGRPLVPRRGGELRGARPAVASRSVRPWSGCRRAASGSSCPWTSCATRWRGAGPGWPRSGSAAAIGWPPTCPTSPRRSSPSWPPPAWGRSGRRAPPSSARAASSTGGARSSPRCCWRSTATATAQRRSAARTRWPRSAPRLPSLRATVTVPYLEPEPQAARHDGSVLWDDLLGPPGPGRAAAPRRVRARAVRPPALRPLLVGHDRPAQGDRPRPRGHPRRAPQGARPAQRPRARRPLLLVLDHGLDDVELPGVGPARRGDAGAVRR